MFVWRLLILEVFDTTVDTGTIPHLFNMVMG